MYRTTEAVRAALWRQLFYSGQSIVIMASAITLRLGYLGYPPSTSAAELIEKAVWRVALLVSFHTAPLAWCVFLLKGYMHKRLHIPLHDSMRLLRLPLATWTCACLLTSITLWPILRA
ncbi:hypothetical protein SAMN05216264_104319 [Pseudomonas marincola]|nr:hypothetical protein SAMN05216264_104319 [Pseudomonas marincola]